MTDSNRVQLAFVDETTPGVTPGSPRMRKARHTSAPLAFQPINTRSNEKRDDRMNSDPIRVGERNDGPVNFELSWPVPDSFLSSLIESALNNAWENTPVRDNDGTADSVITGVAETGGVYTVAAGAAFAAGHLARFTGFGEAGNNGLKKITAGSATVPAVGGSAGVVDEAAPPAHARIKVVGFEGESGDITALADGLGSTSLDFTTLGLAVGQWIKIGGTGSAYRFGAEALNGWARIAAIAANKLTLDNRPAGWTTNDGAGKTLRVFFGDRIKNGDTGKPKTLERGYLGQAVPSYIAQRGMEVNELTLSIEARREITGGVSLMGLGASVSNTPLDASPDPAPDSGIYRVMAASANVNRIGEAGGQLSSPNYVRSAQLRLSNNLREIIAADNVATVALGRGSLDITVTLQTYFGDKSLYERMLAGTATSLDQRIMDGNRALIIAYPRLTDIDGNPDDGGSNTDIMLAQQKQASFDSLTNAQILIDRFEYTE
jgi:hypothetical protein